MQIWLILSANYMKKASWSAETDWIDRLAQSDYAVIENFIDPELSNQLRNYIIGQIEEDALRLAGIGTVSNYQKDKSIRGDRIKWLSKDDPRSAVQAYYQQIQELSTLLRETCFIPISDFEFHLAHYPIGTHYERHLDQFNNRSNRTISIVTYLNKNWKNGDGGEIVLYPKSDDKIVIPPKIGTTVIFRSDILEHEVKTTNTDRYSITGWLLKQPIGLGFLTY